MLMLSQRGGEDMSEDVDTPKARGIGRNPMATGLIGLSVGLVLAYGIGLYQRSQALDRQSADFSARLAAKDAELAEAAAKASQTDALLAAERSRLALSQARAGLYQALNDLDARNFGIANDRLRESARLLGTVDAAALGGDPAQLSAIAGDLGRLDLLVAADLQAQRMSVLELAARLEALAGSGN